MSPQQRFVEGFAGWVELDPELLDRPGTTVIGRDGRAGTGAAVTYWIGRHAVVWCDPEVVDRVEFLQDPGTAVARAELAAAMPAFGFELVAEARMGLLLDPPNPVIPAGFRHRHLSAELDADVQLVRALADRCPPSDVEEAALDLEDFRETSINVLLAEDSPGHVAAYASAIAWDFGDFDDIGVLVDPAYRRRGLAAVVVAATAAEILNVGRLPLYRHDLVNEASAAVANAVGYSAVTTLAYHQLGAA